MRKKIIGVVVLIGDGYTNFWVFTRKAPFIQLILQGEK